MNAYRKVLYLVSFCYFSDKWYISRLTLEHPDTSRCMGGLASSKVTSVHTGCFSLLFSSGLPSLHWPFRTYFLNYFLSVLMSLSIINTKTLVHLVLKKISLKLWLFGYPMSSDYSQTSKIALLSMLPRFFSLLNLLKLSCPFITALKQFWSSSPPWPLSGTWYCPSRCLSEAHSSLSFHNSRLLWFCVSDISLAVYPMLSYWILEIIRIQA